MQLIEITSMEMLLFCLPVVIGRVHSIQRDPLITTPQQAYLHLRKVLHLNNDQELPFDYDKYEEEYAYVAYKIPPTEDSNLKMLPLNSKASLGVTNSVC